MTFRLPQEFIEHFSGLLKTQGFDYLPERAEEHYRHWGRPLAEGYELVIVVSPITVFQGRFGAQATLGIDSEDHAWARWNLRLWECEDSPFTKPPRFIPERDAHPSKFKVAIATWFLQSAIRVYEGRPIVDWQARETEPEIVANMMYNDLRCVESRFSSLFESHAVVARTLESLIDQKKDDNRIMCIDPMAYAYVAYIKAGLLDDARRILGLALTRFNSDDVGDRQSCEWKRYAALITS
jgi:hypothetical protein